MGRTYYQIELTARQLTVLLLLLAAAMVLAFVLGYAAAWTSASGEREGPPVIAAAAATPTPEVEVIPTPTPVPREPTAAPERTEAGGVAAPTEAPPTATPVPPTPTPVPPTATPVPVGGLWVQVLAVRDRKGVGEAERKLGELGFPASHRRVVRVETAGGGTLFKVRIGPFPDRESAHRVMVRMRASGFPDAWIVGP